MVGEKASLVIIVSRQARGESLRWEQRHGCEAGPGHHIEMHRPVQPGLPCHCLDQGGESGQQTDFPLKVWTDKAIRELIYFT